MPLGLRLFAASLCCLLALTLTAAVFVRTYSGQWLDGALLPRAERGGGYEQQTVLVGPAKTVLAAFGSPMLLAALLGAVLVVGVLRRRLVAGVVGVGMVLCAVVVAGAVKSVLPRPDLQIESSTTHNSFPSGHVAVATALLLAFMLVLPGWARRWLAVPGAAGVTVIASATMIAGWHRFSDALGGVLLGVALFCLAAAALAGRRGDQIAVGGPDGGSLWRGLAEAAVGLVVLVWALLVVVPGLAASVQRGALFAIAATGLSTMFLVGVVVFLVRSTDFAVPPAGRPGSRSQPSPKPQNISRWDT
ncbi:membrane-associated phospholipid phosphatase [Micromonospora luteifusca]|uniref:Membrane-associated phospholipid phosphatase n=1 Tax=Micromonospora luteifusca TaxID=709860 RepID=A0ABS2LLL7_9ACTN|nr:phosphatase PAP2 family protein [Micromonospora luteifusca]MBM7489075.1 membrane-associated phospholipid phosphatase [Micromonospora luteifusca]